MLRRIWWRTRKHVMPQRGMTVQWKGHRFLLFLDDPTCRWLWAGQFKEFEEFESLSSKLLREGDIVFDIGAHYGYAATIFSAAIARHGVVLAVEAAPHTVSRMRKQLTLTERNNVLVVSRAVGARSEIRTMRVSFEGRQDWQCVTSRQPSREIYPDFLSEEILVQVTPLDAIAEEFKCRDPCLVKIDIEGGELPALQGASHLLENANPPWLFVEIHKAAQEKNGFLCTQLLDFIHDYSKSQYISDGAGGFMPLSPEQENYRVENTEYFNLLVRPPHGKYSERPI